MEFYIVTPAEEIKSKLDLAEFIRSYAKLDKAGQNWRARCPFHTERTPSFFVSPSRQLWHCFGACNEGGDIFKFLMKIEGIDFPEALKILAEKAGVALRFESPVERSRRARSFEVLNAAANYWHNQLREGTPAYKYLIERGLRPEAIRDFKLGFAAEAWRNLFSHLRSLGFTAEEITEAGLAIKRGSAQISTQINADQNADQRGSISVNPRFDQRESASCYDRFRSRIMFPIRDIQGRIIGFTGRIFALPSEALAKEGETRPSSAEATEGTAKYVNTPETPLFRKGSILYGFDVAKQEIRKQNTAILVEGQMDFLMAWQDEIKNIVATSGTALGEFQLKTLRRLADTLILAFDRDAAGSAATERSIRLAAQMDFEIKIFLPPEEKDIADFVLSHPGKLAEALQNSKPIMEYYFDKVLALRGVEGAGSISPLEMPRQKKKEIAGYLLPRIKAFSSAIDQAVWLEKLSRLIGVAETFLVEELKRVKTEAPTAGGAPESAILSSLPPKTRQELLAERVLGLAAKMPEVSEILNQAHPLFPEHYRPFLTQFIAQPAVAFTLPEFSKTFGHLPLLADYEAQINPDFNPARELETSLVELRREFRKQELERMSREIRAAESEKNQEKLEALLAEFQRIAKES